MALIQGMLSLGLNLFSIFIRLIIAFIVGLSMSAKGRNGLLWGLIAFIFPWIILFTFMVPAKMPKLPSTIRNLPEFKGLNPVVASIMALSAMVAKADGQVTKEEIQLIKTFVHKRFGIVYMDLAHYEGAFTYGKNHPESYQAFTTVIRGTRRYDLIMSLSYLLIGMTLQHGTENPQTEKTLRSIVLNLGLGDYEYMSIKRYYTMGQTGYSRQTYGYGNTYGGYQQGYGQASRSDLISKYSKVLGVSESADLNEIKKAYRKLAKEHHPDKMAAEGMPEDYVAYANKRIAEINEAYEYLKKAKESAS